MTVRGSPSTAILASLSNLIACEFITLLFVNLSTARLEAVLRSELNRARGCYGINRRAEGGRSDHSNWQSEVRSVEGVECLCAKFQAVPFTEAELLADGDVQIDEAVAAQRVATYSLLR